MFDGCIQWVMKNIIPVSYMYENSSFSEHFEEFSELLGHGNEKQDAEYWSFWITL
jgi:hypothetical protein